MKASFTKLRLARCRIDAVVAAHDFGTAPSLSVGLLDQLVSAQQDRLRNGDPERLCGLYINHEFELCGLQDRHVGGFGALENLNYLAGDQAIVAREARSIAE
jgi:hypothetical protein